MSKKTYSFSNNENYPTMKKLSYKVEGLEVKGCQESSDSIFSSYRQENRGTEGETICLRSHNS